jgi:hypothetical protein
MNNLKEKLRQITPLLSADLALIAQRNFFLEDEKFAPQVQTLIFEYFFPRLEISFYPINADEDQLGYKDLLNGEGILKETSDEDLQQLEVEKEKLSPTYQELGNTFAQWFAEVWKNSGGKQLELPTFLITDDESLTKFDMNKQVWVKDESYK